MLKNIDINEINNIAKKAGEEILEIYNETFEVKQKKDHSPLTKADIASNEIICKNLQKLYPNIPIISEENREIEYKERKKWEYLWLIDPLDGTKEFIKRNGEFCINIALIYKNKPVLGVIYSPVSKDIYYAKEGSGAFKNGKKLPFKKTHNTLRVIISRSHLSKETKDFINSIKTEKQIELIQKGSALKFTLLAENKADIYPRLSKTMEWDTAAGDAIIRECGKKVLDFKNKTPFIYNKENLTNPWFIAS